MCPVGEDTTGKKLPWRKRLMDYLEFASVLIGAVAIISSFLWFGFRNEVQTEAQEFLGVLETNAKVDRNSDQIGALVETVTKLLPPMRVAEYDTLRTRIFSPCFTGQGCEYQIRVRRTEEGAACSAPEVDAHIVTDRYGLEYSADAAISRRPSQLDTEWRSVTGAFLVPKEVQHGVAEFQMVLLYNCDGKQVTERTPKMVFEIGPSREGP